jgi:beta-mannanase
MKNIIALSIIMITSVITLNFMAAHSQAFPIEYGIYSTNTTQYDLGNMKINHYFTTWHDNDFNQTKQQITRMNNNGKTALLTVEPWPKYNEDWNRELFLTNVRDGKYTANIANLCTYIQTNYNGKIILRWGHEMDLYSSSRYPWATGNTNLFIDAYRKWVDTCKMYTSKGLYMWSPAANWGNDRYYPGNGYVDYIGFSWYSYPAFEWYMYGRILSFGEIMDWKYNVLKQFNKPIIAAEFGMAEQNKTDVQSRLLNPYQLKNQYPLLQSIILFSDHTESWIPGVISSPDWRIDSEFLKRL